MRDQNAAAMRSSGRGEGKERGRVGFSGFDMGHTSLGRLARNRNATMVVSGTSPYNATVLLYEPAEIQVSTVRVHAGVGRNAAEHGPDAGMCTSKT